MLECWIHDGSTFVWMQFFFSTEAASVGSIINCLIGDYRIRPVIYIRYSFQPLWRFVMGQLVIRPSNDKNLSYLPVTGGGNWTVVFEKHSCNQIADWVGYWCASRSTGHCGFRYGWR